jgi:PBP1b-binding outer membrane lipoprotein LpoB
MKKLLLVLAVATVFAACNNEKSGSTETPAVDTTAKPAVDTTAKPAVDTTAKPAVDTTKK